MPTRKNPSSSKKPGTDPLLDEVVFGIGPRISRRGKHRNGFPSADKSLGNRFETDIVVHPTILAAHIEDEGQIGSFGQGRGVGAAESVACQV